MSAAYLWNEDLWLPENVTWSQIERDGNYPKLVELLYCLPLAVFILVVRLLVEKLLFIPFGLICGLSRRNPENNAVLENAFFKGPYTYEKIKELAKTLNWSEKQVQTWLRHKRRAENTKVKFNESGWRCTFYAFAFLYGVNCLWDKPWLWNASENWTNRSTFKLPADVWWYYMIELGFYVALMISQFVDVKRKDFWQMMIHHVITIVLISLSWAFNCVRVGSLIMLCHDIADIPLETAKLFGYLKMMKCCDVTFVVFLIVWSVTRLWIYPFWIIRTTWFDSSQLIGPLPRYIFNLLLVLLFVLHLIWTWMILQILKSFIIGKAKDVRSDSEPESSDATEKKSN